MLRMKTVLVLVLFPELISGLFFHHIKNYFGPDPSLQVCVLHIFLVLVLGVLGERGVADLKDLLPPSPWGASKKICKNW